MAQNTNVASPLKDFKADYLLSRRLASGSYGKVYLVRHRKSQNWRAAKVQPCGGEAALQESRKEAEILARMDHPHIVKYHDYFEESPWKADVVRTVLVTEFLECGELFDLISSRGYVLNEEKCRTIFKQVLSAVLYLHRRGIAHLDIKPENILMTRTESFGGGRRRVKLIDFGLAVDMGRRPYVALERMCGTMELMAPEVMRTSHVSCLSDMWSLGVVLYMLLSGGVSPFWSGSEARTQRRILKGVYDFDSPRLKNISLPALDLMRQLLIVKDRYRMTAVECMNSQWVSNRIRRSSIVETGPMRSSVIKKKWKKSFERVKQKNKKLR
jgi:serine/threonine protein kinase